MIEGKNQEKYQEFNDTIFTEDDEFQDKSKSKKKKIDMFMSDEDFKK